MENVNVQQKLVYFPSLTEICLKSIMSCSYFRTTEGLLQIYSTLHIENPQYQHVRAFVLRGITERYPMLLHKYGQEELKLVFDPADLEVFERAHWQNIEAKKVFSSLKGTVISHATICENVPREDGSYPLECLVQGSAWPSGIDVTKREQYLSESDFVTVFKMTKEEFARNDKFVRLRLKKEAKLF